MFAEMFSNFYMTFAGNLISVYSVFLAEDTIETGKGLLAIGAGLTGIGMIGASIGQGMVGYGACLAIGRNPEVASKITSTLIITAGFCESGAIYALVIALLILFVL
ncbi:ATP synthase F0 subunit C [Spiroplasma culicicola]|uniref:ATP synthase subunit c n=1 Tax=Spiroplasma culicicola AES-1 TaxID=1276246 RepID=W6A5X9_9MOLU|nr:ATP synthase F0 subunit C [Spiroplasma culicicola]AHI52397.1 F0F1 ATP synthase subunit C [Spiroplasma culicicola AES-1]